MKRKYIKPAIFYGIDAVVFSLLILSAYLLESAFGITEQGMIENGVKILISIAVFIYLKRAKTENREKGDMKYALLGLIPIFVLLTFNLIYGFNPKNIFSVIGILTTAVSEELYYRAFGTFIFRTQGKISFGVIFLLAGIFALSHLVNAFLDPVGALVTVGIALVLGLILQIVYIKTNSIFSVIIIHFAVNMLG